MLRNIFLFIRTVVHLKPKQVLYRIYYAFRQKYRGLTRFTYKYNLYRKGAPLNFEKGVHSFTCYDNKEFTFLNRKVTFSKKVKWDYSENGKLWTYNLNYFDYLNQVKFDKEVGLDLIMDFIDHLPKLQNANEPYTISLRGMNWVKFLSNHKIERKSIDQYLYSQYRILLDKLEYHILGNHLLENGFSLIFGAYYFKGDELLKKGKEIVKDELNEQILKDGAHFELSPMYHRIILLRLLDLYNLLISNKDVYVDTEFESFLKEKAELMLTWLNNMMFNNGETPAVNDSTEGIVAKAQTLIDYANRLGISSKTGVYLTESGYRFYKNETMEVFIDVGNIGPDYIPGHAHSDTFSFLVNHKNIPLIVEAGISTYEKGYRRQRERGTASHNTVRYHLLEQSEVWGGFRVGRRAKVTIDEESDNYVLAHHDGYRKYDIKHYRKFNLIGKELKIEDEMFSKSPILGCSHAYFHFAPGINPLLSEGKVNLDEITLSFIGDENIKIKEYYFAEGYNEVTKAKLVEVEFKESLKTRIQINN